MATTVPGARGYRYIDIQCLSLVYGQPRHKKARAIMEAKAPPFEDIDKAVHICRSSKDTWLQVGAEERVAILDHIRHNMSEIADRWVVANMRGKGIPDKSLGEGDEWANLAMIMYHLRVLQESVRNIHHYGRPRIPGPIVTRSDGQVVAPVFPQTWKDRLLFRGITGEIRMREGTNAQELPQTQALIYHNKQTEGKVALILGAGNWGSIPITDVLYKLFIEDRVAILKVNPVNEYLAPLIKQVFKELLDRGFLRVIQGDAKTGSYLCNHPDVDEIHITGSDKTLEAIVFGPGAEGQRCKAEGKRINTKPITAELGNVSPVIIVPGQWSKKDLHAQALKLASWFAVNAGSNCLTPRVIIQYKKWSQRQEFLEILGKTLSRIKTRKAFYPGAREQHQLVVSEHPEALQFGQPEDDHLPWTIVPDLDPSNKDDICFRTECFCSLIAETALDAPDIPGFLEQATLFANDTLWGNLDAAIIAHPRSLRDPQISKAIDRTVNSLRYGVLSVNIRMEFAFYIQVMTWGAFPGNNVFDIQSGMGAVFNLLMFDRPQKSIIRGPFRSWPDPFSAESRRYPEFSRKLAFFEAKPSLWRMIGLFSTALRA